MALPLPGVPTLLGLGPDARGAKLVQRKATLLDEFRDLGYKPRMIHLPAFLHLLESVDALSSGVA